MALIGAGERCFFSALPSRLVFVIGLDFYVAGVSVAMSPVVTFRTKLCAVPGCPDVLDEQAKEPAVVLTVGVQVTFPKVLADVIFVGGVAVLSLRKARQADIKAFP